MKVLITGGGGFIGSHLADRLLAEGHEVLVIDNYATGRRDNLTERDGLTIVEDTIEDAGAVDEAFEGFRPDFVVHAAASYKDPDAWGAGRRARTPSAPPTSSGPRRPPASSGSSTSRRRSATARTPIEQPVTLDHPIRPDSSYAISKTAGEQYIELSGLDFVSFRLANAYGPRNISGPLPTFFHRLTEGKAVFVMDTRRDFIYVDDLIDVVMQAVVDGKGHGHYHASSGSRLLDQGALRRDDRGAARGRARRGGRGAPARARTTPTRSCSIPRASARTSAGSRRRRSRRACAARSTTTASTASRRPSRI